MLKHERSKRIFEESSRFLAGGIGSSARLTPEMSPLVLQGGKGSKVFDVDGNAYIDYILAWGPLILGHCPDSVGEAVKKQLDSGTTLGSAVPEEAKLSRKVCECLPSVELLRFTNSASEAVHMCLRLARAYTGKKKIVKFEGAYHGWFDNILISVNPGSSSIIGLENAPHCILEQPGIPTDVLDNVIIVPWNKPDIFEKTIRRHADEIAAVIAEPVMCNCGVIPPIDGFLNLLREITKLNEILLIFDETITGFRISLGGAQAYYQVDPDLTVFGKGLGGGYPIAGFGGDKNIMGLIADGKLKHQGTYNSNSLCVVAALATLEELSKNNGEAYDRLTKMGKQLMGSIKKIFSENRLPLFVQGPGPFFCTFFMDDTVKSYRDTFSIDFNRYSRFWLGLLDQGIRIWPTARGLWYISTAHTEDDVEMTLDAIRIVVKELK